MLNDITSDVDGNLYVTDTDAHRIYKVNINDMTYTTFVNTGLGWPNGIIFDSTNNRLVVLNGGLPDRPLIAVTLEDSTISTVVETGLKANIQYQGMAGIKMVKKQLWEFILYFLTLKVNLRSWPMNA